MKKLAVIALGTVAFAAGAEEVGRVLSSVPVVQQVAVNRQDCSQQPMIVQQQPSGAGSLLGAIVGGVVGNQIGHGGGRAAATMIGAVGGAMVGNRVEGGAQVVQGVPQCVTQTSYENRTVGYDVTYEYGGREHRVQLPYDPGTQIRLQVTPVGSNSDYGQPPATYGQPVQPHGLVSAPPVPMVQSAPVVLPPVAYPATYGYAPIAYQPYQPYYRPLPISISLGYVWGGGHRHHHRHWR